MVHLDPHSVQPVVDGLMAVSRMLVGHAARSLAQLDANVTLPQFRTLVVLATGPRRTIDLAAELRVQPSAATRMCDRLVRKDLVARYERPDDRRASWVMLTDGGKELVAEVMRRRREDLTAVVKGMEIRDPATFGAMLQAVVAAAGEMSEEEWQARCVSSG
jgi:DNA-binding MarR family transcriptional regulator